MWTVGLNAHLLSADRSYRSAGVSRYVHSLLAELPLVDATISYCAFLGPYLPECPGWRTLRSPWPTGSPPARILWEQLVQPWAARRQGLDLLHAPVNIGPLMAPCPLIVTVHDLSFCHFPHLFKPARRLYQERLTRATLQRAAAVIAVSQSTCDDIVQWMDIAPDRITVIPNGVGAEMQPVRGEAIAELRRRHQLPEHFVLSLSTLEPRKNLELLLEAYASLAHQGAIEHKLVIAGGKGWYYATIFEAVARLGLGDRVIFPGFVPENDKPLWYSAADLFVYPSLYEGFGLPPLEAMACGTPVVVTKTSSLPEVVGDAGLYIDPYDPADLASAMLALLRDSNRRHKLRQAGLEQARRFSWRRTAVQTAHLYHRILGDSDECDV
ncbi:MAG: glycosyltransferase family 4 protein [Anaerolineae bacterium]|nr:glycosyltransferase family 4 protein [Anaerolineae bacterium]